MSQIRRPQKPSATKHSAGAAAAAVFQNPGKFFYFLSTYAEQRGAASRFGKEFERLANARK
jgi:hypothetical protein